MKLTVFVHFSTICLFDSICWMVPVGRWVTNVRRATIDGRAMCRGMRQVRTSQVVQQGKTVARKEERMDSMPL